MQPGKRQELGLQTVMSELLQQAVIQTNHPRAVSPQTNHPLWEQARRKASRQLERQRLVLEREYQTNLRLERGLEHQTIRRRLQGRVRRK